MGSIELHTHLFGPGRNVQPLANGHIELRVVVKVLDAETCRIEHIRPIPQVPPVQGDERTSRVSIRNPDRQNRR